MVYEIGDLPLATLLPAIGQAEDRLARLDEIVRRSPIGVGFAERVHFYEAAATMWISGELVHIEDLVLHDADRDVRTPTHEITIAHSIVRTRRRIASAEPVWATSKTGIEALVGRRSLSQEGKDPGEGTPTVFADLLLDDQDDAFAAELGKIDAILNRATHALEAAGKAEREKTGPLMAGELVIRDPDWDERGRVLEWIAVMRQAEDLPASLGAALLWDAWESLEPLQRQNWLGAQLVSSYLRSRDKVSSHLFGLNFGLKAIPRERRRSRDPAMRLLAVLEGMALGAELAMKEIMRLRQVRDSLKRKLQNKRSSSSLPGVVELLIARPIVSSSMITKELKVSHRAALNLVAELGVRELTGRGSFRAWGLF